MKKDSIQELLAKRAAGTLTDDELTALNALAGRDEVVAGAERRAVAIRGRRRRVAAMVAGGVAANKRVRADFEAAGMRCTGLNTENDLVEIVEIPTLRWFIGTQFHPEYATTVLQPHPLFLDFVKTL